jgi:hypothetical protein
MKGGSGDEKWLVAHVAHWLARLKMAVRRRNGTVRLSDMWEKPDNILCSVEVKGKVWYGVKPDMMVDTKVERGGKVAEVDADGSYRQLEGEKMETLVVIVSGSKGERRVVMKVAGNVNAYGMETLGRIVGNSEAVKMGYSGAEVNQDCMAVVKFYAEAELGLDARRRMKRPFTVVHGGMCWQDKW